MKTRADLFKVFGFDTLDDDTAGNPCVWRNEYSCRVCSSEQIDWDDTWSCKCNDQCPDCGAEIEPHDSVWIGPSQDSLRALWEALPDAGSGDTWKHADRARRPSLSVSEIAQIYGAFSANRDVEDHPIAVKFKRLLDEELDPLHRIITDEYRAAVQVKENGELEVDNDAEVSIGDDDGAYVMTWTWIYNHEVASQQAEVDDDA